MTKKDYELIAECIAEFIQCYDQPKEDDNPFNQSETYFRNDRLIDVFAGGLKETNKKFDILRFRNFVINLIKKD